jgi:hypothetical protein
MSCKSISGLHPDFPVGAVLGVIVGALRCMVAQNVASPAPLE